MKSIYFRTEQPQDHSTVFQLIEAAFQHEPHSDHREQFLVERLRKSTAFVPELSIVAEENGHIVGYILLTKIQIQSQKNTTEALALAPIAVLPSEQGKGIGSQLIQFAHHRAKELGFSAIILLGHADYYPKFGYQKASKFGIQLPFEVPDENAMAIELIPNSLQEVSGTVVYPQAFWE
ncbi:GNAT family N-acetyltransferase [Riemerella columbina]|uniref:GNAT family N-acetyltransferase n=1 Tax=Riemerella columbina TaxID=103810 RepID=UPI00266FE9F5|nr:N-acetyltransferase [Riemerella columbina]WKS94556.1 N-acetyltransferase [Riemerella columbina]